MIGRAMLIVAALLFCQPAHAADPSHRKACEDLMKMFQVDKMLGPMYAQINKMQEDVIKGMNIPDDMKELSNRHMKRINELTRREMSWDAMKNDFIDVYVEAFTEQDIREMIRFYDSPLGRKTIEKTPFLMQRILEMSQKRVMKLMPEFEKLAKEMAEEVERMKKSKGGERAN